MRNVGGYVGTDSNPGQLEHDKVPKVRQKQPKTASKKGSAKRKAAAKKKTSKKR
jgi:hypothetical protein